MIKLTPLLALLAVVGCSNKFGLGDPPIYDTAEDTTTDTTDRDITDDTGPAGPGPGPGGTDDTDTSDTTDTETTDPLDTDTTDTTDTTEPTGPGGTDDTGSDELDCESAAPPHVGDTCVTDTIACGEVVDFSTSGGTTTFESSFYESATCFIPYQDYDGPERVYELILDGKGAAMTAEVTLESPCEDLSLASFYWTEDECPEGTFHNINSCDGSGASSGDDLTLYTTGADPDRYLIVIDGEDPAAFRLSVTCESAGS